MTALVPVEVTISVHTRVLAQNFQTASSSLEALSFRLPILHLPLQLFPTRLLCQTTSPSTSHRHSNQAVNAITNKFDLILFTNTVCIPPISKLYLNTARPILDLCKSHLPPLYRATSDGSILTARSVGHIATLSGRTGAGEDLTACVDVNALVRGLAEEVLRINPRVCGGYHTR